jgi:chromosome condensin MukBEF complex kleisin-like MukF subunit
MVQVLHIEFVQIRVAAKYEVEEGEQTTVAGYDPLYPGLKDSLVRKREINILRIEPDRL